MIVIQQGPEYREVTIYDMGVSASAHRDIVRQLCDGVLLGDTGKVKKTYRSSHKIYRNEQSTSTPELRFHHKGRVVYLLKGSCGGAGRLQDPGTRKFWASAIKGLESTRLRFSEGFQCFGFGV